MKTKIVVLLIVVFCVEFVNAQIVNIVPLPKTIQLSRSLPFEFSHKTKIFASDDVGRKTAGILNDLMLKNYGFKLEFVQKQPSKNVILIEPQTSNRSESNPESYTLNILDREIRIGGNAVGQFYALQSLMQLLPLEFKGKVKISAVGISDEPRFKYRGMHLDSGRHFMPVSFVKKYIDLMSQYKLNQFHWHLTEDQGWRIEIKKYPKLTEIGSKRSESHSGSYSPTFKGDGIPVEGFYTQDEIRDVVAYAKSRFINVIPEIELPGHSSAALAAYPEFGCKPDYKYSVQKTWGIFKEVYCPTEKTFQFLEDILAETIALFPDSPYIHIGGDEVLKDHWKESAEVQELMKRENLKDEHEVQSYFIRRMERFINSKGKQIIGWDEILEGGLAPNAVVMSWRGEKGGIEAAKAKHDVVMTPGSHLYFDHGQGDPKFEPLNIGAYLPLEKVYSYNPTPAELNDEEKKYVIGVQANLWTEYLKKPENVEYMVFPRMFALAEIAWSPLESKNFENFQNRLSSHYLKLDKQNVNYRIPEPKGLQNILITDSDKAKVELESQIAGGKIFYTLDGSEPNENSAEYKQPFEVSLANNEKKEIRTIVTTANKRKSVVYTATLLRRAYLASTKLKDRYKGVRLSYYKGLFATVAEMEKAEPIEKGVTQSIQLSQFAKKQDLKEPFGAIFDGLISVPKTGIYEFQLEADDGAILMIDDEMVVDNDGQHEPINKSGIVPLMQGSHRIRLKYFQSGGGFALNLRWGMKGTALQRISGSELEN